MKARRRRRTHMRQANRGGTYRCNEDKSTAVPVERGRCVLCANDVEPEAEGEGKKMAVVRGVTHKRVTK